MILHDRSFSPSLDFIPANQPSHLRAKSRSDSWSTRGTGTPVVPRVRRASGPSDPSGLACPNTPWGRCGAAARQGHLVDPRGAGPGAVRMGQPVDASGPGPGAVRMGQPVYLTQSRAQGLSAERTSGLSPRHGPKSRPDIWSTPQPRARGLCGADIWSTPRPRAQRLSPDRTSGLPHGPGPRG